MPSKRGDRSHIRPVPESGKIEPGQEPKAPPPPPRYKPDEFIIPAHDEHNQSIPFSFRAAKKYASIISEIVWSRKFPYKTPGDIYRHAMDRHLHWLESLEPGTVRSDLAEIDSINEGITKAEAAVQFGEWLGKLEQIVSKLISSKLRGMAVQLVYDTRKRARQLQHPLLRELFTNEIQSRFGHLLSGAGMDLNATTDESTPEEDEFHRSWGYEREQVYESSVEKGADIGVDDDDSNGGEADE